MSTTVMTVIQNLHHSEVVVCNKSISGDMMKIARSDRPENHTEHRIIDGQQCK